jgi:hypothetical protein
MPQGFVMKWFGLISKDDGELCAVEGFWQLEGEYNMVSASSFVFLEGQPTEARYEVTRVDITVHSPAPLN